MIGLRTADTLASKMLQYDSNGNIVCYLNVLTFGPLPRTPSGNGGDSSNSNVLGGTMSLDCGSYVEGTLFGVVKDNRKEAESSGLQVGNKGSPVIHCNLSECCSCICLIYMQYVAATSSWLPVLPSSEALPAFHV